MVLGALVFVSPFLGFPSAWDMWFIAILGVLIVIVAYLIRPDSAPAVPGSTDSAVPYVESKNDVPIQG